MMHSPESVAFFIVCAGVLVLMNMAATPRDRE